MDYIILKTELERVEYNGKTNEELVNILNDPEQNIDNDESDKLDYSPKDILECYADNTLSINEEVFLLNDTQTNYIDNMRKESKQFEHTAKSIGVMRILLSVIFSDTPALLDSFIKSTYQKISKAEKLYGKNTVLELWDIKRAKAII